MCSFIQVVILFLISATYKSVQKVKLFQQLRLLPAIKNYE